MTGAFAEQGHIHNKAMQGGASDGGLALTAYVVVALLENGVWKMSYSILSFLMIYILDS